MYANVIVYTSKPYDASHRLSNSVASLFKFFFPCLGGPLAYSDSLGSVLPILATLKLPFPVSGWEQQWGFVTASVETPREDWHRRLPHPDIELLRFHHPGLRPGTPESKLIVPEFEVHRSFRPGLE